MIITLFFKLVSRIQFLATSTNQHGVHSPFVFDFVTKGLYQKSKELALKNDFLAVQNLPKKEEKILSNICNYFKINQLYTNSKKLENSLDNSYKLLYFNTIKNFMFDEAIPNSSQIFFVIHGIHSNSKSFQKWKSICKNNQAIVTIDVFYFGLVFFRRKQVKEHFKIRV